MPHHRVNLLWMPGVLDILQTCRQTLLLFNPDGACTQPCYGNCYWAAHFELLWEVKKIHKFSVPLAIANTCLPICT